MQITFYELVNLFVKICWFIVHQQFPPCNFLNIFKPSIADKLSPASKPDSESRVRLEQAQTKLFASVHNANMIYV